MEEAMVHGVLTSHAMARITVTGLPDRPGSAARVLRTIADLDVAVGTVVLDRAFDCTVRRLDGPLVAAALKRAGYTVSLDDRVSEITVVGAGLRSVPAVAAGFCAVLARAGTKIELVSMENGRMTVVCGSDRYEQTVRALCREYRVDATEDAGFAVA
ncbi:Aspartokinase [Alloactinosynnema sp. L-07]|uniref:ACT domain-containing protein n=1 Tax=Alloactinosynnema sp. L-07 TaxID=1653480 RepID=UPI00065F0A5E|nr:ACT domain-containing protein [Alloactinosynnema sp. L-07]CRK57291.1 Aspartokinase [Alloactinosynnema sp. L-07]